MYDRRLASETYDSFKNRETWIGLPLVFVIGAVVVLLWLFLDGHIPPYDVRLNPETDYGGTVYLYENMNPVSSAYIKIPTETICIRVNGEVYTQDFDPPLEFYKLNCRGANGYVRTNKVILP